MKFLSLSLCLINAVSAAYSASGKNVVAYWGQSAGNSLGTYCAEGDMDIAVISFLNNFNGNSISFNFGSHCSGESCPDIAKDILACQKKGVKVFLSLGGGEGSYSATKESGGATADQIYAMFGPKGTVFPGATIDGIDLDIEKLSGAQVAGYTELVEQAKAKFGKNFLVSAAPQCVFPDAHIGTTLQTADIDMAFIQFYNNDCSLDKNFNWDQWVSGLSKFSNKNMKLYIGIPASAAAAPAGGYVTADKIKSAAAKALKDPHFGGFMVWSAELASTNGKFLSKLKPLLAGSSSSSSSGYSSDSDVSDSDSESGSAGGGSNVNANADQVPQQYGNSDTPFTSIPSRYPQNVHAVASAASAASAASVASTASAASKAGRVTSQSAVAPTGRSFAATGGDDETGYADDSGYAGDATGYAEDSTGANYGASDGTSDGAADFGYSYGGVSYPGTTGADTSGAEYSGAGASGAFKGGSTGTSFGANNGGSTRDSTIGSSGASNGASSGATNNGYSGAADSDYSTSEDNAYSVGYGYGADSDAYDPSDTTGAAGDTSDYGTAGTANSAGTAGTARTKKTVNKAAVAPADPAAAPSGSTVPNASGNTGAYKKDANGW